MEPVRHPEGKMYYSIGEVAEMFDVSPTLIRFWEKKFDVLSPRKNTRGNRMFTPADVDNLGLIYHLVKERGMTLAGAQKRMKENPGGLRHDAEVVERLLSIRAMLAEIRAELESGIPADEPLSSESEGAAADAEAPGGERIPADEASAPEAGSGKRFVEPTFDFGFAAETDAPQKEDSTPDESSGSRIIEQTLF